MVDSSKRDTIIAPEQLVMVKDNETDADIEDESDDFDTNENPFDEASNAINTRNLT